MTVWAQLPPLKGFTLFDVTLTIIAQSGKIIQIKKDTLNNLTLIGMHDENDLIEEAKSLTIRYVLSTATLPDALIEQLSNLLSSELFNGAFTLKKTIKYKNTCVIELSSIVS